MTFSFDTIDNFDDHIANSIPNYRILNEMIVSMASFITVPNTSVIDIGAGVCNLLESIDHDPKDKIAIEPSARLLFSEKQSVRKWHMTVQEAMRLVPSNASLIMSIFTLQFIPQHERQMILNKIYESLIPNGAFIWAEKVRCDNAHDQEMMTFSHYDLKKGYFTADEIMEKEQDLRRLMRPNTSVENLLLARNAGFKTLPLLIWKMFNFECFIFRKVA